MKKMISILMAVTILLSLTGCTASASALPETAGEPLPSEIPLSDSISFHSEQGSQSLTIAAQVSLPQEIPTETWTLTYDAQARERLFEKLITDPADLAHEDENGRTVGITFDTQLHYGSPLGDIYFEDHRKTDWHEKSLDEAKFWGKGYFSPHKPGNFQISAKDAAQDMADFLKDYSCLDFVPARAEAREGSDGAYYFHLSTVFRDLPVLSRDLPPISGQVRESGIEGFQGVLLLKEAQQQTIENPLSLQQALERLKTDCFQSTYARNITFDRILCCYVAIPHQDSWVFRPSWVFLGQESGGYIDPYTDYHMQEDAPIAYLYDLEDGFLDIMNANQLHDLF